MYLRAEAIASASLFLGALLLYVRTMPPTVAAIYDDSLEFPLVVQRLAIAHPTGYPLYTLLGKLFSLLPFGDIAHRLHLFSAVCAAAAVVLLYLAARRGGLAPVAGLAAALTLAVSPVFWAQALIAEVYALNALFVVAVLAGALHWGEGERSYRALAALCFTFGLSLAHHRTMLLLAPALALYLALAWRRTPRRVVRLDRRRLLALAGLGVAPLLLYLYIPLRGLVTSSLDGVYENSLRGFLAWVTGSAYAAFFSDATLQPQALQIGDYATLLRAQFGVAGLALALVGLISLGLRQKRVLALLVLAGLTGALFVRLYRVADAPVFLIPVFIMVALALGAGVQAVAALPVRNRRAVRLPLAAAGLVALIVPSLTLAHNLNRLDASQEWAVHNYAADVLSQPLEQNATIIGILGEMTLFRYFQETHGWRPDVQTVAADRDDQRRAAVAGALAAGQPVYLTRALAGLQATYSLRSLGPLLRVTHPAPLESRRGAGDLRAVFGQNIALLSFRLTGLPSPLSAYRFGESEQPGRVESGGRLRLCLSWQITAPAAKDYHVTVRLKTVTGQLVWQRDAAPVLGSYATSAWRRGEIVDDCHELLVPVGTAPGTYDLDIGLYDPATLQALPVNGQPVLLTIGPVSVIRPAMAINLGALPLHKEKASPGLDIPGGRFDYSLQQLGIQRVVRANLQNEFQLYGYGVAGAPLRPGQTADVTLLWQALRRPLGDRIVFVQLVGAADKLWASQEGQPAYGLYATEQWERGEVIRDVIPLTVPADIPDGDYSLRAGMYDPSGARLTVLRLTRRSMDHVELGRIAVHGRPRSFSLPPFAVTVNARIGNLARLAGFDHGAGQIGQGIEQTGIVTRAGQPIQLRLVWQVMEPTLIAYTAFVHLVGADGKVVSQIDSIPGQGTLPTTSWVRGEALIDGYTLPVPAATAAGQYSVQVGLYDAVTGRRLPIWDRNGAALGDSLTLTKVRVDRAP